jgi:hypothetical protein
MAFSTKVVLISILPLGRFVNRVGLVRKAHLMPRRSWLPSAVRTGHTGIRIAVYGNPQPMRAVRTVQPDRSVSMDFDDEQSGHGDLPLRRDRYPLRFRATITASNDEVITITTERYKISTLI